MIINEIFYSLQGEGRLSGMPSVFIRLAGCPLRCRWCDTKYAWSPEAGESYSINELIRKVSPFPTEHVVVTGGEPMVDPELGGLLNALANEGMHITVETSGINFLPGLPCDLMSISPKMSNSMPSDPELAKHHEEIRFDAAVLQELIDSYEYQLKFVVDKPGDLDEIADCMSQLDNLNPYNVFLMPQATSREEYLTKSQMVAAVCEQTGFAMSPRLQVMLWDNKRGK